MNSIIGTSPTTEQQPIPCRCRRWRRGLLSDHRDWPAELERARQSGRLVDEVWFEALTIEAAGIFGEVPA